MLLEIAKHCGYAEKHKKISKNEYAILCPFHNDKNPSCNLNEAKGVYHCLACGAKGTAITMLKHRFKYSHNIILSIFDDVTKIKWSDYALQRGLGSAVGVTILKDGKIIETTENVFYEEKEETAEEIRLKYAKKMVTETLDDYRVKHYDQEYYNDYLFIKKVNIKESEKLFYTTDIFTYSDKAGVLKCIKANVLLVTNDERTLIQAIDLSQPKQYQKMMMSGSVISGSFTSYARNPISPDFVICEGLATALSFNAVGYHAIVCFTLGNLKKFINGLQNDELQNYIVCVENGSPTKILLQLAYTKGMRKVSFQSSLYKSGYDANDFLVDNGESALVDYIDKQINKKDAVIKLPENGIVLDSRPTGNGKSYLIFKDILQQLNNGKHCVCIMASKDMMRAYKSNLLFNNVSLDNIVTVSSESESTNNLNDTLTIAFNDKQPKVILIMFSYFQIWLDATVSLIPALKGEKGNHYNENLYNLLLLHDKKIKLYLDEWHGIAEAIISCGRVIDFRYASDGKLIFNNGEEFEDYQTIAQSPFDQKFLSNKKTRATLLNASSSLKKCFFKLDRKVKISEEEEIYNIKIKNFEELSYNGQNLHNFFGDEGKIIKKISPKKDKNAEENIVYCKFFLENNIFIRTLQKIDNIHISTATFDETLEEVTLKIFNDRIPFIVNVDEDKHILDFSYLHYCIVNKDSGKHQNWDKLNVLANNILKETESKICYVEGSKDSFITKCNNMELGYCKHIDKKDITTLSNTVDTFGTMIIDSSNRFVATYMNNPKMTGSNIFFGIDCLFLAVGQNYKINENRYTYNTINYQFNNKNAKIKIILNTLKQTLGRIVRQPPDRKLNKVIIINEGEVTNDFIEYMKEQGISEIKYHDIIKTLKTNGENNYPLVDLDEYIQMQQILKQKKEGFECQN